MRQQPMDLAEQYEYLKRADKLFTTENRTKTYWVLNLRKLGLSHSRANRIFGQMRNKLNMSIWHDNIHVYTLKEEN